ncbi:hypothetical protein DID88_002227 [Monilinia fructigena]|uniref:Uncharacterized protein n=1 Tax=Monilinia fructigena TaxID=38457 RepID=A0A395ID44_9HELO|nr:hypothetical protein DID88_002227 [Monilinia fructigena]
MVRRERVAKAAAPEKKAPEKKKKRKAGKQLLSFGDDGEGAIEEPVIKKKKAKAAKLDRDISSSPEPQVEKVTSLLDRTNAQIAELKASMKRNVHKAPEPEKKKSALEAMIPATSVRGRKRNPNGKSNASNDQAALDILRAFREKLESAPPEKEVAKPVPQEGADAKAEENRTADDEEAALAKRKRMMIFNDKGWMSHALSFKEDKLGKDLSYRKKAEDELVVIDPREKAKTLREEEMKAKREARAGASTGREWDVKRNEKLARGSALAGRGAK